MHAKRSSENCSVRHAHEDMDRLMHDFGRANYSPVQQSFCSVFDRFNSLMGERLHSISPCYGAFNTPIMEEKWDGGYTLLQAINSAQEGKKIH